jgi:copper(I)-binding protein/(2Fe-2S) ferredoxin
MLHVDKPPRDSGSGFDVVILLGRGMPLGEQEKLLPRLGDALVAAGHAARSEVAFVEVTQPSLDEVLVRLDREGVRRCLIIPVIVPFDRNLRGWLGRALSQRLSADNLAMEVVLADAPDDLAGLTPLVAAQAERAVSRPDVRDALKPLRIKPGASTIPAYRHMVNVCLGPRCAAAGGWQVFDQLKRQLKVHGSSTVGVGETVVVRTACQGPCNHAPLVNVQPDDVWYGQLDRNAVDAIVKEHLSAVTGAPLATALRPGARLQLADGTLAEPDLPKLTLRHNGLVIEELFLRPAMRHERALACFMTLHNEGDQWQSLDRVHVSGVEAVAVHDPATGHRELTDGMGFPLFVPPKGSTILKPGAMHMMLMGLDDIPDLAAPVPLRLEFSGGGCVEVSPLVHAPAH